MKIKNIKLGSFALVALFVASSCSQSMMTDVNQNPNQAEDAPLSTIVTSALAGSILPIEGENARIANMWSQTFTGFDRQYAAYDIYNVVASDFHWEHYYYGNIQQANLAISKADANSFYAGICKVSKANSFGLLTSLWGDIPFSEANDLVGNPSPKFDAQTDVYAGVQDMLDDAIVNLNAGIGGGDVDGVDFFYSGDASLWVKAANSLKARYYMHTKNYTAAATAAALGITDPAEDMMISHGGLYNINMNIYASFGEEDRQGYMIAANAFLPTMLDTNGAKNDSKTNEGERFSDLYTGAGDPASYDLNYAGSLFAADASFPVVTAAETHLILAEAAYRSTDKAGAITHLNHVRQALAVKYPAGQYDDYVDGDFATLDDVFHAIMMEKYASLVGQIEVYNDIRRTKNEIGLTPKGTNNKLPQRYLIPQDEINGNTTVSSAGNIFDETPVNQ